MAAYLTKPEVAGTVKLTINQHLAVPNKLFEAKQELWCQLAG